jgi:4-amino-4-deoxy-L-arabinose transferase-like glycosyltransferase
MDFLPSILLIVSCLALYYFAYISYKKNLPKISIWLIISAGIALRVFISSDDFLHKWDERYHALVAKNLSSHFTKPTLYEQPILSYDYRDWTKNHVWLHKQPLPLWLMGISIKTIGATEFAVRLPSIILSTFGIFLVFFIGKNLSNTRVGLFAAFLFSLNGLIIELTAGRVATDHIDIAFMFFVLVSIAYCIKYNQNVTIKRSIITGILIGLSMLCKWLPGLFVIPVWLILNYDPVKRNHSLLVFHAIVILTIAALIFLPWQLYTYLNFPSEMKWETFYNFLHFNESVESHTGSVFYYLDKIRINYGELIYLPLIWFSIRTFRNKNIKDFALLSWFVFPLIFFSLAKTKMQGYLVFAAIPLLIMTAEFFYWLIDRPEKKWKWLRMTICIALILLPIRYTIERLKLFEKTPHEWADDLKKQNFNNGILFNCSHYVEAMFYTNVIAAYPQIPTLAEIDSLHRLKYDIYLNVNGLSSDFQNLHFIKFVSLHD